MLRITDTTLRDAHQSLWATRMRTDDIMGIIDVVDAVGYYSLEVWGGATFDVCLRFLRENPWERLRQIKARAKTPLQMLLRGQNVLGYKHYPDDLRRPLRRHGLRQRDGHLPHLRRAQRHPQPAHRPQGGQEVRRPRPGHPLLHDQPGAHGREVRRASPRSRSRWASTRWCIKDMAGILSPVAAEELVSALVKAIKVPIQVHCHATSGMATAMYLVGGARRRRRDRLRDLRHGRLLVPAAGGDHAGDLRGNPVSSATWTSMPSARSGSTSRS